MPSSAYAVIVTRGHRHDLDALRALAPRPLRYLGLIGSRAKVKRIYDVLVEEGVTAEQLEHVHAPIGLDIGAVTPQEIAVSIVAELIAVRRGKREAVAGSSLRWMPKLRVPEVRVVRSSFATSKFSGVVPSHPARDYPHHERRPRRDRGRCLDPRGPHRGRGRRRRRARRSGDQRGRATLFCQGSSTPTFTSAKRSSAATLTTSPCSSGSSSASGRWKQRTRRIHFVPPRG